MGDLKKYVIIAVVALVAVAISNRVTALKTLVSPNP